MPDALTVHVNREELHSLAVPERFETDESFDVVLVNHGESTHVHLHVDDALSDQVAVEAPNHHVAGDGERRVEVTRTGEGTARGNLKIVTAYGATTRYVDVSITEPAPETDAVEVGEDLSKPQPRPDDRPEVVGPVSLGPLLAASGAAVGLAVGGAAVFGSGIVVVAAIVVALLAVGVVAWALAVRGPYSNK